MKRVGELYEVVVFTASVSKVGLFTVILIFANNYSMVTLFWINWTFTVSSIIACSEKAVTTTKEIM